MILQLEIQYPPGELQILPNRPASFMISDVTSSKQLPISLSLRFTLPLSN